MTEAKNIQTYTYIDNYVYMSNSMATHMTMKNAKVCASHGARKIKFWFKISFVMRTAEQSTNNLKLML